MHQNRWSYKNEKQHKYKQNACKTQKETKTKQKIKKIKIPQTKNIQQNQNPKNRQTNVKKKDVQGC